MDCEFGDVWVVRYIDTTFSGAKWMLKTSSIKIFKTFSHHLQIFHGHRYGFEDLRGDGPALTVPSPEAVPAFDVEGRLQMEQLVPAGVPGRWLQGV